MPSKTANALVVQAYRLLAKREYSAHELLQKFLRQASRKNCDEAMHQLQQHGVQSDARFAESLCRSRFSTGKGPDRIRYELRKHHIDDGLVDAVMQSYSDQWAALAEKVRIKKFGAGLPENYPEFAKQMRFLRQRGFSQAELSQYSHLFS